MSETRCYYCGNDGTRNAPLSRDEEDHLAHVQPPCKDALGPDGERVYPADDPNTPIPACGHVECQEDWDPCPQMVEGFERCMVCAQARRRDRLAFAASVPARAGHGFLGSDETIVPSGVPSMTARDGTPFYVCRFGGCAGRFDQRLGGFKKLSAKAARGGDPRQREGDADAAKVDAMPEEGIDDGMSAADLASLWDVSLRTARTVIARGIDAHVLVSDDVPTRAGGSPRKVYWRRSL